LGRFDKVLFEKARVLQAGGLHVIGTNLHDSRRIDGQLRGRAGRQGDPGSTHFFLSLEDRIFRLFGGDKIKGMLDFLRIGEDTPLESGQVRADGAGLGCRRQTARGRSRVVSFQAKQ